MHCETSFVPVMGCQLLRRMHSRSAKHCRRLPVEAQILGPALEPERQGAGSKQAHTPAAAQESMPCSIPKKSSMAEIQAPLTITASTLNQGHTPIWKNLRIQPQGALITNPQVPQTQAPQGHYSIIHPFPSWVSA